MGTLNPVQAASGSPPVHGTNLSLISCNPPMIGVAGWRVTVGVAPVAILLLVVAADGAGLPKSASSDEASSSSIRLKENKISISSWSDSVENWGARLEEA